MNRHRVLVAVLAALVAGIAVWLYLNLEQVSEREHVGFQGEALRNPYLASQKLLERMGKVTRVVRTIEEFETLPPGATLVLTRHRAGVPERTLTTLLEWVERGGHLIVEAEHHREKDLLLERLKIARLEIRNRAAREPSVVRLPHAPRAARVHFGYWQKLQAPAGAAYRHDDISGTHVVHVKRGSGGVTVLPDLQPWTTQQVAANDHAEFVWQLTQFFPASNTIVFAARLHQPMLLEWLWEHARPALFTAMALLALWLWSAGMRFGPVRPDAAPNRLGLMEHLRACGRLVWRCGGGASLLAAARAQRLRRVARICPWLHELPQSEAVQRLATTSGLRADQIEVALYGAHHDTARFTLAMRVLQQLEQRLVDDSSRENK